MATGKHNLRRAFALVGYWSEGQWLLRNYLSGKQLLADPTVLLLLAGFDTWQTPSEQAAVFGDIANGEALLSALVGQDVLLEEGSALELRDRQLQQTWRWGREAQFFHFATRDVPYEHDIATQRRSLLQRMAQEPPPSPYRKYSGKRIPLSQHFPALDVSLSSVLFARRTQREFADCPLDFSLFASVLQWTWGKTRSAEHGEIGPFIQKTSPSGGSRHSIEVYPWVFNVRGLDRGVYHYDVEDNALVKLGPVPDEECLLQVFAGQPWVPRAPVLFVMASRITRSDWKYRHAHAYRVLLMDAGHLGQTFHLVCTALQLAPFTLAGFNDTLLEKTLGIDGIGEICLYAAACGEARGGSGAN